MTADTIARLKITLDDVKPIVLRRVEVPATLRLDRLHLAIQAAMGWTNTHLYEILVRDAGWGIPDPDRGDGTTRRAQGASDRRARRCRHKDAQVPLRIWLRLGT